MPVKDPAWALGELREYLRLHERVPLPDKEVTARTKTRPRGSKSEREAQTYVAMRIWHAVFGARARYFDDKMARQCMVEIERGSEIQDKLTQDDVPVLDAADLHPWVWEAARPHWLSGNHDAALWAAGINVNSRLQLKVGRKDLSETRLLRECFSIEGPEPGRPRLRLCGNENPNLFKDRHLGAMQVGSGVYAAVRNPLNHVVPDDNPLTEREALECLAAFSLLSRWIERAKVVRDNGEPDEHEE